MSYEQHWFFFIKLCLYDERVSVILEATIEALLVLFFLLKDHVKSRNCYPLHPVLYRDLVHEYWMWLHLATRMKDQFPATPLFMFQIGSDPLEGLFGMLRTCNHNTDVTMVMLEQRMGAIVHSTEFFLKHPSLDQGYGHSCLYVAIYLCFADFFLLDDSSRRLQCTNDHINAKSWTGDCTSNTTDLRAERFKKCYNNVVAFLGSLNRGSIENRNINSWFLEARNQQFTFLRPYGETSQHYNDNYNDNYNDTDDDHELPEEENVTMGSELASASVVTHAELDDMVAELNDEIERNGSCWTFEDDRQRPTTTLRSQFNEMISGVSLTRSVFGQGHSNSNDRNHRVAGLQKGWASCHSSSSSSTDAIADPVRIGDLLAFPMRFGGGSAVYAFAGLLHQIGTNRQQIASISGLALREHSMPLKVRNLFH